MTGRTLVKFISYFLFVILLLGGITFALVYYYQGKTTESPSEEASDEAQMVGYINPENALYTDNFSLCGQYAMYGYYHSSAPKIYKGGKNIFRDRVLSSYDHKEYQDSGYLNFRFHINCRGEVGNIEVNELNADLEIDDMTDELVDKLIDLTRESDNWELFAGGENNYYMYLNFKIKDGEIVEILP
ncbi:MAG: hypothetical protein AAFN93_06370 [Bacteroidota bacterium]